ncbi:50S ribosomal protein L6 [Candidatus Peregrinibacteria bacterium HGW-Peregrinibacteria-1]|jgi:large subunit ribosomal protein L6|nr:ribosomal protein L6 [uncultured bacterium]PKL36316.1 MAG: 50S ribosomal protein L6 [Candidatus Peregrinibacteria bacterium HGW-Peregrinibacteria-1]
MSRIGKQPVEIPTGVTVEVNGAEVTVRGSKGELKQALTPNVKVEVKDNQVLITRIDESKESRSLHGLTRSLIANMVSGVSNGFEKQIEIVGVGYRAQTNKNKITLNLGFSHPIEYVADKQIEMIQDEKNKNLITIKGIDKQVVGETAAKIRSFRKPEPYKGKGIKYVGEHIVRKAGKSAGSK